jgi:hypothetical protein
LPGCNHGNGMYNQTNMYQSKIKEFVNRYIWFIEHTRLFWNDKMFVDTKKTIVFINIFYFIIKKWLKNMSLFVGWWYNYKKVVRFLYSFLR